MREEALAGLGAASADFRAVLHGLIVGHEFTVVGAGMAHFRAHGADARKKAGLTKHEIGCHR